MLFKIPTPQGVRIIGRIEGDALIKTVKRSKHFHRKTRSWGIQLAAVPQLEVMGIKRIVLHVKDTGEKLTATLQAFKENGIVRDFGHGEQLFLKEEYWDSKGIKQLSMFEEVAS